MRLSFYTVSALMAMMAVNAIELDQAQANAVKFDGDPKDVAKLQNKMAGMMP